MQGHGFSGGAFGEAGPSSGRSRFGGSPSEGFLTSLEALPFDARGKNSHKKYTTKSIDSTALMVYNKLACIWEVKNESKRFTDR